MVNPLTAGIFGGMYADEAIAARFAAPAFVAKMLSFEAAWTRALCTLGEVSAKDADAALIAIAGFAGADLGAGSDQDGIPVPLLVQMLRRDLDDGAAKAIHSGATSQDVIDTAMVLTLLDVLHDCEERLTAVVKRLDTLSERFGDAPLMARTRMQAALPATAGLRIDAWRRGLSSQIGRIAGVRAEIGKVQVGGAIGLRDQPEGNGSAIAALVADDLGLSAGPVWHTDRSAMLLFGQWLVLVTGSLGKMGQDIALMAQQGVDAVKLRGGGGSSAMPHKQNPVAAEALVTLARYVAAQQGGLGQAMIHEQERSGAAWALEWMILPAMAEATGAALRHAQAVLDQIDSMGDA